MEIMEIDQNRLEKLMKSHEVLFFSTKIIRYSIRGDHRSIFPDFSWRPAALARASTGSPIRATRAWSMEPEPVERAETREPGAPDVSGIFMMIDDVDDVSNMFQHIWVWAWNLRLNEPVSLFILFSCVHLYLGSLYLLPQPTSCYTRCPAWAAKAEDRRLWTITGRWKRCTAAADNTKRAMIHDPGMAPTAGRGPETWVTLGNCRISHLRSLLMFVEQRNINKIERHNYFCQSYTAYSALPTLSKESCRSSINFSWNLGSCEPLLGVAVAWQKGWQHGCSVYA